jgi:hypothetical protein
MDKYVEIRDWSLGVISANEPDIIPTNAVPKAYNTAFRKIGQGQAVLGLRPGLVTVNDAAISGTPVLHRMVPYYFNSGSSSFTKYIAIFGNDGTLRYKEEADTLTAALAPPANYPFSSGTAFTAGDHQVDATVMANRLFAVNTNGERRSLLDDEYVPFGLSPIATIAVTAQAGGTSSMPLETYDVSVTSYNEDTGAESSALASVSVTTAGANDRIRVVITPTTAESAQYTHWRIYLRRQTTQARLYRVLAVEDLAGASITATGDIPIATLTGYIDLTATQIANLILQAPSTTENNPPLTAMRFVAPFGRRLIGACRDSVYWSKLDLPDAFPPENTEPIETGEGDEVTGIFPYSDEVLLIFTTSSTWGIFGNDPQSWTIRPVDTTIGCTSHLSTVGFNGGVGWWSDRAGPVFFKQGQVQLIGLDKLGSDAIIGAVESSRLNWIAGGVDPRDSRVLWSVPTLGTTTRNDKSIPYNFLMQGWEATHWDPLDFASFCTGYNADGTQVLFAWGYEGQLFYFDPAVHNDAIVDGTTTGTFVAASSSVSSITGTGFYNSNGRLTERKVTIVDADNKPIGRGTIASNNATTLTLASAVEGLSSGSTYTYYIGGADFRLYTKWIDGDEPFVRKRFDRVYLQARAEFSPDLLISTHIDFIDEDTANGLEVGVPGDEWDLGIWDTAVWAGSPNLKRRLAILKCSTALRVAILHFAPDFDIVINKVAVLARLLSDRYYD